MPTSLLRLILIAPVALGVYVLASASAWAGRPVFRELTLDHLVQRADAIALAQWQATPTPPGDPCQVYSPKMHIVLVIKGTTAAPLTRGQTLSAPLNTTALQDCQLRQSHPGSAGASFAAERVSTELKRATQQPGASFLVFLQHTQGHWGLVADDALLDPSHLAQVRALLEPAPTPGAPH